MKEENINMAENAAEQASDVEGQTSKQGQNAECKTEGSEKCAGADGENDKEHNSGNESRKSRRAQKKAEAEKIAELEAQVAKDKDDYLRLMAEFDNFRRRTAQDRLDLISTASKDIITGLLPIVDDFERALKALGESDDSNAAKEGTTLIYNKLMTLLKGKGLVPIEALGKEFDTNLHEAVAQFPVEDKTVKGKVFDVVQTGYTLGGKVIRFAKVVVAI